MPKTLSTVACNLGTQEAEQTDVWEFKASLVNLTNSRTVGVHVSKTIQKARKRTEQRKEAVAEQEITFTPKGTLLTAARAKKAEEKTAGNSPTQPAGMDRKLPWPSPASLKFLITPGVKTRGVLSLRSKSSSCTSGTAPGHSAVSKSRMLSHLEAFPALAPYARQENLWETSKG